MMKNNRSVSVTAFLSFALFLSMAATLRAGESNPKPFVIPELKNWEGGIGMFRLSQGSTIAVPEGEQGEALLPVARALSSDLKEMFGLAVPVERGRGGSIRLESAPCGTDNDEGYSIDIGRKITVKANRAAGAFWATRTLLQMLEQGGAELQLPKGCIIDYPDYPLRGLMMDVGRKYVRLPFLQDYVKFLAYYKMNTFHLHLSDNGFIQFFGNRWEDVPAAFRLECDTYPGLASPEGHYSKQEFIDLQKSAEECFVTIIPEIDIPAHSLAFTHYCPELGSKEYGMDHLDLFNPKTYIFFDALFKEYLSGDEPLFRGPYMHIGTDEYSNRDRKVVEQFRSFTDHYIREVEKYGKKAAVWGALTHAKGETPVKSKGVLMYCWYNGYADPKAMMEQGYDVVSIPDGMVYIVPAAGYYYDYLNCEYLYKEWTPAVIGNQKFEERHPQIKGGLFAIWNDHCGNGITEKDMHDRLWPAMQTLSQKMWSASQPALPFGEFNRKRLELSEAPGVNQKGRVKGKTGTVLQVDTLRSGEVTPMKEVGYPYRVEFTLTSKENKNGAVLFRSDNGIFYLREPKSGLIAFERENYRDSFPYEVPNGESVRIAVEGDNLSTALYVNDTLCAKLEKQPRYHSQDHKTVMYYMPTFFFPLQQTGVFNGLITDLKVIQINNMR